MYVGCVLWVCDPSSCELRRVAAELWVYILCLLLFRRFVRLAYGMSSFRTDSVRFVLGFLVLMLLALGD